MPNSTAQNYTPKTVAGAVLQRQAATMEGLYREATAVYETLSTDNPLTQNAADRSSMGNDAFRHAYASARATQEYGSAVAGFLGRGVEWMAAATRENDESRQNAADIGMDLHNNSVGREIGRTLGSKAAPEDLRDAIEKAALEGKLIMSPSDPRALKVHDASPDMKALGGAYDGLSNAKAKVSEGLEKASDLIDKGKSLVNSFDKVKDSLKDALEKAPNSSFFKFSEAQLEKGEAFASTLPPGTVERVAGVAAVADNWEMPAQEFAKLDPSFDKSAESKNSSFDKGADRGLQDRVESGERQASQEREMEMSMEA
ncbi:hypothetical protein LC612_32460 [Nostoc sp. CHAB 5834]|nr:hypothetical protein [Nostoc sp. CHAB 5834]